MRWKKNYLILSLSVSLSSRHSAARSYRNLICCAHRWYRNLLICCKIPNLCWPVAKEHTLVVVAVRFPLSLSPFLATLSAFFDSRKEEKMLLLLLLILILILTNLIYKTKIEADHLLPRLLFVAREMLNTRKEKSGCLSGIGL